MHELAAFLDPRNSVERLGLIVERGEKGVHGNVDHVTYHSFSGYNFGYAGAGPSDLALSVLCRLIPPPDKADEDMLKALSPRDYVRAVSDDSLWSMMTPSKQRISRLAWRLHQPFQSTFIVTIKGDSGYLPLDIMKSWIEVQSRAMLDRLSST